MNKIYSFLFAILSCCFISLHAQQTMNGNDSLQISLLTCSPGNESYSLYGHTAIRVNNLTTGQDIVFNYGLFSFQTKGFLWKFILGDTNYFVGAEYYDDFIKPYENEHRTIQAQILNLTSQEANQLANALINNCNEEGWTYHYNYLKDNCTTRAVNMILAAAFQNTDAHIVFPTSPATTSSGKTYRNIIHQFSAEKSPWTAFGQDIILGNAVDTLITQQAAATFPIYAEQLLNTAKIVAPHMNPKPLVSKEETLVSGGIYHAQKTWFTPNATALIIFFLSIILSIKEIKTKQIIHLGNIFNDILMLFQGLAGIIIFILFFFSVQPAVDSNWLILMLNPIPMIWLPIKIVRDRRKKQDYYMPYVAPLLAFLCFIPASFIQVIPLAMQILALSLLLRGISALYLLKINHHL